LDPAEQDPTPQQAIELRAALGWDRGREVGRAEVRREHGTGRKMGVVGCRAFRVRLVCLSNDHEDDGRRRGDAQSCEDDEQQDEPRRPSEGRDG
jgi:hypothetical protein